MNTLSLEALSAFIVRAKCATYVGSGQKLLPYRLGSHDLQYFEGAWAYHDTYVGESDFIGEEVVYHGGKVVWAMNYFGRILQPDKISSAQAGEMIKQSLTRMYAEDRFLGGFEHTEGDLHYVDTNEGDVRFFTGKEWIDRNGEIVYELVYHGGIVRE
ncbi:MAG: hypothetical protein JXB30_12710 [Anaerolineae bacterium]|nr:hypothetical protein [Anaerolineae bacterium]